MFGKTKKLSKEYKSLNATLLLKAGYINMVTAGVYTYLPMGLRVIRKIEEIVRRRMDTVAQEILMPSLAPKELWEKTGRLNTVDCLFKASGANELSQTKNNTEYILNATHEEVVTPLAQDYTVSYKQLPFALYQFQNKFRNEPRAKSGLLRGREFRMKDAYSFHSTEEDLNQYYDKMKEVYMDIYKDLGIGEDTFLIKASGGDFTSNFSHEIQTKCENGEDLIFHSTKTDSYFNREIAPVKSPEFNQQGSEIGEMKEVLGEGMIGVEPLAKYLNIDVRQTTKTLFFETEPDKMVAVAIRGDYFVNELKLRRILVSKNLKLASKEFIKTKTGAEVGYAGVVNLPKDVELYFDDSCKGRINFETGANKTDYHVINVNFGRDLVEPEKFYDFKLAKEGDIDPETNEVYEVFRGSEVGNIFPLGTKYSDSFDFNFIDEKGQKQRVIMGCYGIGISRIMGVIVEKFHDEKGIIWPKQIAPFQVHLLGLNIDDVSVKSKAEEVYTNLSKKGIEVLFDDRNNASTGEKFSDADLIGIPVRIVVSKKTIADGNRVELKYRNQENTEMLSLEDVFNITF